MTTSVSWEAGGPLSPGAPGPGPRHTGLAVCPAFLCAVGSRVGSEAGDVTPFLSRGGRKMHLSQRPGRTGTGRRRQCQARAVPLQSPWLGHPRLSELGLGAGSGLTHGHFQEKMEIQMLACFFFFFSPKALDLNRAS